MNIKILIADDYKMMREDLRSLIESQDNMTVVDEAENGKKAIQLAKKLHPDVIVMDIRMPELNGIEATRQILADLPETKIIALSVYSDKRYILGMLKAGASGYILKNSVFDEIVGAIAAIVNQKKNDLPIISKSIKKAYSTYFQSGNMPAASPFPA